MTRAFASVLLAALTLVAACTGERNVCGDLQADLRRCGLPLPSMDCSRIDPSTQEQIVERVDARGCDGLRDDASDEVDPRVCALAGWPCPGPFTPEPSGQVPAGALALVAGIDGSPTFDWNPRIVSALTKAGVDAHHVKMTPWATTEERSFDLWQSLELLHGATGKKLNLVCYAVGGLDCRYVASPEGLFKGNPKAYARVRETIASVTTIATPHRGTRVADAALAAMQSGAGQDLLAALLGGDAVTRLPDDAGLARTLQGLGLDPSMAFNETVVDGEGIYYQSFAGVSHVLGRSSAASEADIAAHCVDDAGASLFFHRAGAHDALAELLMFTAPFSNSARTAEGKVVLSPSDGMIAVESAKWGTFRGCVSADHYDFIGQIGHTTRDPVTGFDAPRFYRWIASDLAARGL